MPVVLENIPFLLLVFALGLVLGSFYNVCIHRFLTGESIVFPASHCPHCKKRLSVGELVPLVSYLLLRGRCKGCSQPISARYPAVELISGVLALLLFVKFGPGPEFGVYLVFGGMFIIASFIDLAEYILPDFITLPGSVLAVFASTVILGNPMDVTLIGAAIGCGSFFVLQRVYRFVRQREGLGTGDVKLMFLIGALNGPAALPYVVILAGVSAIVIAGGYMLLNRKGANMLIPFGPFLCCGSMCVIFLGDLLK